jgi:RNA 3'-terminal phosphate cyclase
MGYLNILHSMGADLGSEFSRRNKCPPGGGMVTAFVPNPLAIVLPLVTPFVVPRQAFIARCR